MKVKLGEGFSKETYEYFNKHNLISGEFTYYYDIKGFEELIRGCPEPIMLIKKGDHIIFDHPYEL